MKKWGLLLCMAVFGTSLFAQGHLFEVKRLSSWAKEYLTVTNDHYYGFSKFTGQANGSASYDENEPAVEVIEGAHNIFHGLVVLEINGQSTKGMSEQAFYTILDNSPEKVELKVWATSDSEPETLVLNGKPLPQKRASLQYIQDAVNNALAGERKAGDFWSNYTSIYKKNIAERNSNFKKTGVKCNELIDPDFDWFYVNTYDFAIVGDDPLVDRAILEKLHIPGFWQRDTENPDVIFTIAKDSRESISSTYVPPTVRTINHGSKTTAQYNALTRATEYTTKQNNQTIREGGYTQTTSSTDMFLEISLLDAKRINDPDQQAAPIVWQATFDAHADIRLNVVDVYKAWATWVFMYDTYLRNLCKVQVNTFERMWACDESNVVTYATPDSYLKVGDKILKYKNYKKSKWATLFGLNARDSEAGLKSIYSKWWGANTPSNQKYCDVIHTVCVERGGKKLTLNSVPFLKKTGDVVTNIWQEFRPE